MSAPTAHRVYNSANPGWRDSGGSAASSERPRTAGAVPNGVHAVRHLRPGTARAAPLPAAPGHGTTATEDKYLTLEVRARVSTAGTLGIASQSVDNTGRGIWQAEHLRLKQALQALEDDKKVYVHTHAALLHCAPLTREEELPDSSDCVSSRLSKQLASAQDTAKRVALHQQYGPRAPPNAAKLYDAEAVRYQRASVSQCSLLTDSLPCIQRSAMLNLWQILRRCSAS